MPNELTAFSIIWRIDKASPPPRVVSGGQEPGEAVLRVIGRLLFGKEDHKAVTIGKLAPAGPVGVSAGGLRAAVKGDDEAWLRAQGGRHVHEHAQIAGIAAERCDLAQRGSVGGSSSRSRCRCRKSLLEKTAHVMQRSE
jgi:hypothetical protein